MVSDVFFVFLFWGVKALALLPLRALFVLADVLYFFVYYVVRYRRRVVRGNLRNSFPGMSGGELRGLERRFYRHFADFVVETVKLAHISQEELLRRACIRNPGLIYDLLDRGHSCVILMMGHYGNWEWFSGTGARFEGRATIYQVYRPLSNRAFDRLFVYLRTRFRSFGIEKGVAIREIVRLRKGGGGALLPFLADQTPSRANLRYWTSFLNQDSAFLTGAERIARRLDLPVVFADVTRVKRGFYAVDLVLIAERAKETEGFFITERYARLMENTVLRDPAFWLWTHRRWKFGRGDEPGRQQGATAGTEVVSDLR